MPRRGLPRRAAWAVAPLLFACAWEADAQDVSPEATQVAQARTLDRITVTGNRPSTLPISIPTTTETISAEQIGRSINATDAEDALKYFPSLLVRRRYIGDYDHAVLATRASGTGNSARSLVYADGMLLSNLLGNGAAFTPRWGLVTPEEIERVDVLYGPYSAAYPGNSAGAIVDYLTRMPRRLEAHVKLQGFTQKFALYRTDDPFGGYQGSASIGSREGGIAWWVNVNRLDSDAQPITYATRLVGAGTPGSADVPVSGAVAGLDPRNRPWLLLGTGTQTRTMQDHAKLKLAYDFLPTLRASYTLGLWTNTADRAATSFLHDAAGSAVYAGTVNVDGRSYTLTPADFTPTRTRIDHLAHGLSIKSSTGGTWDWEAAASLYDYARDEVRSPTVALPGAQSGGAGRIADQSGTGWNTLALKGTWRPGGAGSEHIVEFGAQRDAFKLRNLVSNTTDWLGGAPADRFSAFTGDTTLTSLWAQDGWRPSPHWRSVLGLRAERWRAFNGSLANNAVNADGSPTAPLALGSRSESHLSPKAALSFQPNDAWTLKASIGRAVRMPTVSELYQGSIVSNAIVNNDPNLKPEKSWTGELSAETTRGNDTLRATLFAERTRDALYSQTNVTVTPNVTSIQNVDAIRTHGLELAWQAEQVWLRGLDLLGSITYADSKITRNTAFPASVDKRQPRVPLWRAHALAHYAISSAWSASLGMRYSSRQFGQLDNSDPNGYAYTGFSSFVVADLRIQYRFDRQWSATAGVDTLTNKTSWAFHPYPQRTWHAELKWDL